MQRVFKLALAVIGISVPLLAQEKPAANPDEAKTATAPARPVESGADRNIRFQFDGIPYMDLVERFAQMANKPLLAETNVQGTVTFNDPRPYTYAQALETLNTILAMKNVMLVETERYLQLVPFKELPQMPLKIFRGLEKTGDVRPGEVVTVVLELKNLDAGETATATSAMLSGAGSIAPLSRGKGLIITDRLENIRRIQKLLEEIDTSSPVERQMKTYTLLHSSGAVVTDLINKTFGVATAPKRTRWNEQAKRLDVLPPDPEDYVTAVFDEASRTLLLFGPAERIQMAEDLIKRFEQKDGARGGEVKIYYPRATKADDLARMIREAIPGVAGERESGSSAATKARVIVDDAMNRLIVTAPVAGQLDSIENLINRIERGTPGASPEMPSETVEITKVLRLQTADPATAFRVLTNAFTRRLPNGRPVQTVKANLDQQTKTIVITGSPGDVQHALGIVEQMENIEPGAGPMETVFLEFPSTAELKRVQPLLQQLYSNQVADGTPGATAHAKFVADPESRRLIVTANARHLELIQKIAEQLRAPSSSTQPREFRALTLKNLKVDTAFKTISDLVAERMNDEFFRDVPKPLLLADAPNNRLLVTANAAQLEEIQEIVRTVDSAPAQAEREFRGVKVYSRTPAEIATLAEQLYKEQLKGQPNPLGGPVSFVPESAGNRVIVIGSAAEAAKAEALIRQIDPARERSEKEETRVFRLRNAQAQELAGLIEKSLNLQEDGVKLLVDQRSNSLVISGSGEGVERAAQMIEQLDVAPNSREVRMIDLKVAQAREAAGTLRELLAEVMRNRRGANYTVQSRINADDSANRLIVTAPAEELEQINLLVRQLDTASEENGGTRVFRIQSMPASDMERIVSDAMTTFRGGGGRRARVSVSSDDRSNSLVVTGDREDLQDVASIIEKLDGAAEPRSTREVKVLELQTDEPSKLVAVAQQVWNAQAKGRRDLSDVTMTLEPSGKRVIIVAPSNLMKQVEQVLAGLDQKPDGAPRSLEVVELKSAIAGTILPTVTRLYEEQEKGKGVRPATIVPEATGKRLMIYGSQEQVNAIREIVDKLETGARSDNRETRVYNLNSTTADDLLSMVRSVYQQEIKKRPELGAPQALLLADPLSNRLIVSGLEDELNIIEEIIEKLDKVTEQTGNTRAFQLKNAQAQQVATLLSTTLTRWTPGAGRLLPRVTVGIDANNNTLIVSGQPADLAAATTIIEKLDSIAEGSTKQLRIFPVHGSNTDDFAARLRELYNEQVRSKPDNGPADALILADVPTDRLIISASEKQVPLIERLVQELDALASEAERQLRLFTLQHNSAAAVSSIVREMFSRNLGNTDLAERLVVTQGLDPNTLVAEAPKPILERVAALIEQVDTPRHATAGRTTKILNVGSVEEVQRLAPLVQQLYREQLRGKEATDPADAQFIPDIAGGRMIVTARTNHLEQIEALLAQLRENNGVVATDHETRIFNLTSSTASELAQTVNALYTEELRKSPALTVSKALILPDPAANRIIISGSARQLDSIEKIIKELDRVSPQTGGTRVFKLKASDATQVAALLSSALVDFNRFNSRTTPRVSVGADTNSNSLVVSGEAKDLNAAALIIEQLDDGTERKERQMRILPLKGGRAAEVATKVRTLYLDQVKNQPGFGPADALILGDSSADRLIITASEAQLELLQKIVQQLEETGGEDQRQLAVRPLKSSSARSVAAMLQQFFARNIQSQDPLQKLLLSASPDDRSLILEGSPEVLKKVNELTETLESRFAQDNVVIQTVRLEKAQAENVAEAVNRSLAARGPTSALQRATVTPVANSNSLLIDGPAEAVQDVMKVIKDLDEESTGGDIEIRVYKLEHGKARELSSLLNRMLDSVVRESFRRRGRGARGSSTLVVVTPDERTNSLIISAGPDQFKMIEQLLVTMDQNAGRSDRDVRFVILKNARALSVLDRLEPLFDGRPRGERPVIEADSFANSITIIGSKSDIAEAESVIAELDKVSRDETIQVRMLVIENLPAVQMARMLQSLYSQMSQAEIQIVDRLIPGETNQPPAGSKSIVSLAVDRTSNALLMSGPSHELDAINNLVDELTWSAMGNEAEFRQFVLKEADPVAVAKTLNELFRPEPVRAPQQGQQQGQQPRVVAPEPRMTIVAEPRTRSIVVRGKSTDFILLEALLQQLDVKSPHAQLAYRLVKLEHADPQKVLPLIQQLITQIGLAKPGDPVSVTADMRTRSIFAVGRATMLDEVEQVIKGLDTPPAFAEAEVAMIALKNAVASQVVTILQTMLRQGGPGGQGGGPSSMARELQEQIRSLKIKNEEGREVVLNLDRPIRILADSAPGARGGNRVIISSTADNVKALSAVVEMMDTVAVTEGVSFKIVRLENADAQTVASTLTQIFAQGQRLAVGPAGPAQPASETGKALAAPLNVATDQRSNSLVLSGQPETLDLALRLIRDLDAESKGFITEVRLYRLDYASASRLAPLLQSVFAEAGPVPGTEGLTMQVTRLQTMVSTNDLQGRQTAQPKIRAALTIQADDASNTLVVAARADIMPLIADVVKSMDIPAATGMDTVRIYPLKNADAARLQRMINEIYAARGALMRPEEKPALTVDTRTNALIVSGNERGFSLIETFIKQLDQELPFEYGEFRVIKLENADAEQMAGTLQRIIDTRAEQKAALTAESLMGLRAIVLGDPRINSIIVGGSKEVFELVEALARQLDVPGLSLAGQIRLIPLKHANAGTLSTSLNMLFSQRYAAARTPQLQRSRPVILPDPRMNALLVSAGVEDNKALDELLSKLDQELEDPALVIEVIGLRENDAGSVAQMIQNVFAGRLQAMTLPGQLPNPQDRVIVSADSLSNALIVVANRENLETIRGLIEQVDVEPNIEGGILQILTLKKADAGRVASMLRSLVSQGLYRPGMSSARGASRRAREAMAIAVDTRSNTLIVSASPENMAIIRQIVERIDSEEYAAEGDIKLYTLRYARASQLAQTLQQFFSAKRSGESQGLENTRALPVTILADDRTNTLLVTGGRDAFAAVERMIAQLDSQDVYEKMNFRVVTLRNSTATKLQGTLTRLFANRPPRVPGRAPEPITIVADQWANALVIGASVEDMDMVLGLIETIDTTQPEQGMQVAVIPIEKGDATGIAQTIRSLYREGPNSPITVQVDVDERINAIVVSAGEADLQRIQDLVRQLDTSNVARVSEIRIFPLHHAQAEELSTVLTIAFTGRPVDPVGGPQSLQRQSMLQFITRTPEGEELVASALKESLLITADRRRNALVISAPVDSMNLLAKVIATLDSESPQMAKIRVFKLTNADARQMAEVLTSLFRLRQQPGVPANQRAIQYTLVRDAIPGDMASGEPFTATIGSAEQFALTVTIDLRTNSLLLGGTDHYVGLASHIIEELDSSPALERITEVYRLKNAQAKDVETSLRAFVEQERQRITMVQGESLGGAAGPASAQTVSTALAGETVQQLMEREMAVVADTNSNSLLISASPRYFNRFKEIIEKLDEPQAQVLIQVILAEVTLDKTSELGVEWTIQGRKGGTEMNVGTDFGVAQELSDFGGFSSSITGSDVSFLLRALEADGRLEVLSRPQILTADNQEANIDIGERVPIVTEQLVGTSSAVNSTRFEYEDVGVSLTVTPRISPDGTIKMVVAPEISQLTSSFDFGSIRAPIINQRKATTTVTVQDGHSVIIGGLISTVDDRQRKKVPFLGNIPYLGFLFRNSRATSDRKELLIILTPQLLLNKEDGKRITNEQLQRSTIKDEIRRDKLQQEILQPILPYFDGTPAPSTNAIVQPPKV